MPHLSFSSLRLRLTLLVLAATLPGLALILYMMSEQRQLNIAVAEQNAMRVVHQVTSNQKRILEGAHQFLAALSRLPDMQNPQAKTCSTLINDIVKQVPAYNNLGVVKATGDLACSARLFDAPDILADHPSFREALQTGSPAVGGYRVNGKSNLVYLYPVDGRSGTVQTILFVEFGFDWFSSLFVESKLPQGSVLTLRDQSGAILARYPDAENWVGKAVSEAPIYKAILAQKGQGKAEAKGADGILRYYVFTPLGTGSGKTELTVSVGIPKEALFADIERTFFRDFTLLFFVGLLTVAGGLIIGEPLIRREVGDLVLATERLRIGDLKARIGPPYSKGELGHLARAFDRMAEALQKHQIEIEERTADLAESNRALRAEIQEREKTTEELARRHQELLARHRVSEIVLRTQSLDAAFQEIVDEIGSRTPFPIVAIELYDEPRDMMVYKAAKGIPLPSNNGSLEIPAGRSLSGIVAHTGEPLVEADARVREHSDEILRQLNCQTFLCVPMKVGQRVVAVLSLASSEKTPVSEDFVLAITGFANHIASLIEHRRAEGWLHSLIATTQDAIVSIDRDSRIVLFNSAAEKIFGYTQAEAQGQKVNLLMADPYSSEHDEYIARFERTHEPRAIGRIRTVSGRRKNGDVFPVELSLTHISEDDEVPYAALIRDISEKKRLQDRLIENERLAAIGTTSAKLAHEIANPLNGMAMTAKLLERYLVRQGSLSDEKIHSALQTINNEIRRLRTLLEEFRSLYRRENYNFQPTFLSTVIKDVLALEAAEYTARGIQVKQSCPEDLPPVMADKEKLTQALLNLCRNAAEAMPNGGKMTVRAHTSGDEAILEVEDTGTGIPDGIDILEPFATTKASGTGLGLVIVRQIVAAHKGTLAYASKPDKGAIFRLILPQHPPEFEAAAN